MSEALDEPAPSQPPRRETPPAAGGPRTPVASPSGRLPQASSGRLPTGAPPGARPTGQPAGAAASRPPGTPAIAPLNSAPRSPRPSSGSYPAATLGTSGPVTPGPASSAPANSGAASPPKTRAVALKSPSEPSSPTEFESSEFATTASGRQDAVPYSDADPVVAPPPRPASVDRLLVQVAPLQVSKALLVLQTKGIKSPGVEGDAIEFECPSHRVSAVLTGLLEARVDLFGLARMPLNPPGSGNASEAPAAGA